MNKTVKRILIIVGILLVLFVLYKLFAGKKSKEIKVATEKVSRRVIVETVNASGKIYPEVEVKISPDISGEITELNVQEGDSVKRGQVLARIYADIYALQRDEAASRVMQSQSIVANSEAATEALRATMEQAQQTYDRNKTLYDQKVISKAELEQYETALRSAKANLNAAQQNTKSLRASVQSSQTGLTKANKDLGRTTLVAPMDGVISSLQVKKGERVAGNSFNIGTEMMTIADMNSLEVRVDVGENDIVKIHIGDSADVKVDAYNNRKFKGVVTKIASSTRTANQLGATNDVTNYEVRIRLDKDSYKDLSSRTFPFRPGMTASADISTQRKSDIIAVPISAVHARIKGSDESLAEKKQKGRDEEDKGITDTKNDDDNEFEEVVFILQTDGTVKKVVVRSGIQDMNYIEIRTGLKTGEEVITDPYTAISKDLKDGTKVTVVPKDKLFEK
jgi:HlyD family secretion protein